MDGGGPDVWLHRAGENAILDTRYGAEVDGRLVGGRCGTSSTISSAASRPGRNRWFRLPKPEKPWP